MCCQKLFSVEKLSIFPFILRRWKCDAEVQIVAFGEL